MKIGVDISIQDAVLLFNLVSHACKTCACTPGSVFQRKVRCTPPSPPNERCFVLTSNSHLYSRTLTPPCPLPSLELLIETDIWLIWGKSDGTK